MSKFILGFCMLALSFIGATGSEKVKKDIDRSSLRLISFGAHGIDQKDLFGDPMPRSWFLAESNTKAKYYNYHIRESFYLEPPSQGKNSRHDIITVRNPSEELTIAIVAKYHPYTPHLKSQRFLINLEPLETLDLNFLGLPMGYVDFYCMAPFDWQAQDMETSRIRSDQVSSRSLYLLPPTNPENRCTVNIPATWQVFCFGDRYYNPHCIRVVGESNGGVALASMNWWFECPGEETYRDEMYQYTQVFYPTRDDLYHKAKSIKPPPCNPDPRPFGAARDIYLDNSNYGITQNVYDSTKQHHWHGLYRLNFEATEERAVCVGSSPCEGGFRYQKHWTCE